MVFESVITDVMNRFLGDFIEDLDSKNLNVGIWGGDVVLKNLKLKQDALKELDLPVQTIYGRLGTLVLKIPWKNLYSMPVVVSIEDLFLLVAPNAAVSYNAAKQEAADLAAKRAELQKLDELREHELKKTKDLSPTADKSFTEKLVTQIINNVQIKIRNVHIRYEDRSTSAVPFAFGVTLGSLEVHTTDADWRETFLSEALSRVFKLASLDGLAVYMNCDTQMFQSESVERFNDMFMQTIARKDSRPQEYTYVLGPINAVAKLKLNPRPESDVPAFGTPKVDLFVEMQKLAIGVTRAQYQRLITVADGFGAMTRGLPYRKYRPHEKPVIGNAKLWWKFAYTCIVETDIRRRKREWSWPQIEEHRRHCRNYAVVYEKRLVTRKPLKETLDACEKLEERLDLFNLRMVRQRVEVVVEQSGVLDEPEPVQSSWFGGWWGGSKSDSQAKGGNEAIKSQIKTAMTAEEKAKLFAAIGYDESETSSILPVDYVAVTAQFKLNMLELSVRNEAKALADASYHPTVMLFQLQNVTCNVRQRPATAGLALDLRLTEMSILGHQRGGFVPRMVRSRLENSDGSLLDVKLELNPLDGRCDQRLHVSARPLEIVYDAQTVIEVVGIFQLPRDSYLAELSDAATVELSSIKERSATGIQYMVDKKSRLDIQITVMPNYVVVPQNGFYVENETSAIIISLGQMSVRTVEPVQRREISAMHEAGLNADEIMQEVRSQAYNQFSLDIQNIQVLVAVAGESWQECLHSDRVTVMHIIEPIALNARADMCIVDDDPQLPRMRITATMPRIGVSISDERMMCALALVMSIPLPSNGDDLAPRPLTKGALSSTFASSISMKWMLDAQKQRKPAASPLPPKQSADPTAELTQFTAVEFSFVMNELCVNVYRVCDLVASPGTHSSYRTPPEEFHSAAGSVATTPMSAAAPLTSHPMLAANIDALTSRHLSIRVRQLELGMVQRTYDMRVSLKLGAFGVNQLRPDDAKLPDLPIIETPTFRDNSGYLFTCAYTNVNKASPEFATRHKSVEQLVEVHFSVLNVRLHQERLAELQRLAHDLQVNYEKIQRQSTASGDAATAAKPPDQRDRIGNAGPSLAQSALDTIAEEIVSASSAAGQQSSAAGRSPAPGAARWRRNRSRIVDSIQLKLVATMERVAVVLECERRQIAEMKIEQLSASVVMKKSYTDLSLKLQDIVVIDPNPLSRHSTIVTVMGGDALQCQVVMYDLNETANYNLDNMKIDVSMGCVKVVFLNWFVTSVLSFLGNFQEAQRVISEASAAAAVQAKQNMVSAYETSQRMRLNIQIKAPIILVPIDSQAHDAIAIDFGYLAITNVCSEIPNSAQQHGSAILDEMRFELKALKLSRVHIEDMDASAMPHSSSSVKLDDTMRLAGLTASTDILSPTTFALLIRRNLSASWYRQIPDLDVSARVKSIVFNLLNDDAQLVLSIMAKNLTEGADEFVVAPANKASPILTQKSSTNSDNDNVHASTSETVIAAQVHEINAPLSPFGDSKGLSGTFDELLPLAGPKRITETFLKFTFQMDSVVVNLSTDTNVGLASFGIYHFSLKGYQLVDKSVFASIVLCDIQLDDRRPDRKRMITRFMKKKDSSSDDTSAQRPVVAAASDELDQSPETTMLDIVVRMTEAEMFVNLVVSSFDLILSLEFLMKIIDFLTLKPTDDAETAENTANAAEIPAASTLKPILPPTPARASPPAASNAPSKKITVFIRVEQPDIILVEQMDNINCLALVLNMSVVLRVRMLDQRQIISGEIGDLQMFVCEFNPSRRARTKHYVLHPCRLTLHAATPEATGMNISLTASDIRLNISPGTINLLNKAMATFAGTSAAVQRAAASIDHSDLWLAKPFVESQHWYMRVDGADEAWSALAQAPEPLPEVCVVEMPSIVIVVETGFGYYTTPMLHLKSCMNAELRDWSSDMTIGSTISLSMSYYNSTLAIWEPIIEPNEHPLPNGLIQYAPWELNFNLHIDKTPDLDTTPMDEAEQEPRTKIQISSSEALEMTVTRSCLDVLQDLSGAFTSALSEQGLQHPENVAPYVVQNDTGFPVTLSLLDGPLRVHRTAANANAIASASAIATGGGGLVTMDSIDASFADDVGGIVQLAPGERLMLKADTARQSITSLSQSTSSSSSEMFLSVRIGDISKEVRLPIHKADRRYFPLYRDTNREAWGIISDVTTEYGSTTVTLHGVVRIHNHFSAIMQVWRRSSTNRMVAVGQVQPGEVFNVPLHALYADKKELFFSLDGYKTSVQGINWTEQLSDFKYTKLLHCDPRHTFEPFYITAIRERHEIYHEVTSKHTMLSAYYVIHLHPPLYVRNALPVSLHISVAGCSVAQPPVEEGAEAAESLGDLSAGGSSSTMVATAAASAPNNDELDRSVTSAAGGGAEPQVVDFLDYGEKEVRPGDVLHLPTVKPMVKEGQNRSYIVARILKYLDRDWSCTTEIPSNPDEFAVWVFNSYDSVSKMTLELGVKFDTSAGNLQLVVYCPYWMVNKTGLMLSYRASDENVNVLYHPPDHDSPILFSFSGKHFFGKKQAALRVESGAWSDKFALDAAGSTGKVECKFKQLSYHIAVTSTLTSNSLTKQIVFTPYYVIINKAPFAVEVQEDQRPGDPWLCAAPDSCVPLWPRVTQDPMLRVKTTDEAQAVSVPFRYVTVQSTLLKLANKFGGINVDVQCAEGGTYIVFTEYHAGDAPALIVNHTSHAVHFWERGNVNRRTVQPFQQMMYTWSDPTGSRTIYWDERDKNAESDLRRDGLNEFRHSDADTHGASSAAAAPSAYWVSFLDGTQRVLLFTESFGIAKGANSANRLEQVTQEIEVDIHGIGLSLVDNARQLDIVYISMASSGVIWEELKRKRYYKALPIQEVQELELFYQEFMRQRQVGAADQGDVFGMPDGSIVDMSSSTMGEVLWRRSTGVKSIRRTFYPGLWLSIKSSPYQLQLHAKINRIQIDNQLMDCIFPVVLAPVAPPKSVAASTVRRQRSNLYEEHKTFDPEDWQQLMRRLFKKKELKPFIECSIVQRVVPFSSVKQFKYMTVLIQEFHVKVDLLFINAIVAMVSQEPTEETMLKYFRADIERQKEPLSALALLQSSQEEKNFYDNLHLGPLKIHLSFSMAGLETTALPGVISTILQGVGVTLTDVNDVVFKLAFFERNYQFFTPAQLNAEVISHYTGLALKQAYVLILGLDVIGNPYGLVVGITTGVGDLFYEPFQGAIQGPGEFAEGLVLGVRSLFGHTVGGAAGAVSKITGAMGKGLAALTFDKSYQAKRRKQLNRKPANLQEGLARGGKGLVMGVYDGVTGVFTKPISGAKAEGVEGFFKGLGKGAVGLVARPTAGLVDFASGSFDAVKRATDLSDEVTRQRARRLMHADGVVRPYSRREAEGNLLLKEVEKGRYASSDVFVDFYALNKRQQLLLTDQRCLFCVKNDLFGGWQTEWTYRWAELMHVRCVERGIELLLGEKNRKVFGLFGGTEHPKKLVPMPKTVRQQQLVDSMQSYVRIAQSGTGGASAEAAH